MLLITFGRAASQELRDRVRRQITDAAAAFDDPSLVGDNELVDVPADGHRRASARPGRQRLRDALAGFDAATIATTHQFCQLVLKSLGVAGDSDSRVHAGGEPDRPGHRGRRRPLPRALRPAARRPGADATPTRSSSRARSSTTRRRSCGPLDPPPESRAAVCVELRQSRSRRTGDAQAPTGHPRLRRPADAAGRGARRRGLPRPAADAPALAHRDGRRVPGHRPRAVAGDRPGLQRPVDGHPDRRSRSRRSTPSAAATSSPI